jgi:hypothetical protein
MIKVEEPFGFRIPMHETAFRICCADLYIFSRWGCIVVIILIFKRLFLMF